MKHRRYLDGAGYFINDDRPSGGRLSEDDVLGCAHCQRVLKRKSWLANGGYCHQCDQELCVECATAAQKDGSQSLAAPGNIVTAGCANFKRFVDRALADDYRKAQNARILGI